MRAPRTRYESGFSYWEVLAATVVLTVALLPALESLQLGVVGAAVHETRVTRNYALFAKMEDILAQPFSALETEALAVGNPAVPTSFSDAGGTPDRRMVYLSQYDADNADGDDNPFTDTDPGLVWVRVEIEDTDHALESLTTP